MRKQEERLIITFHTTADAIATERICKDAKQAGRMIPVPRELSAGCGLAWCTEPGYEEQMRRILAANGLEWQTMTRLMY